MDPLGELMEEALAWTLAHERVTYGLWRPNVPHFHPWHHSYEVSFTLLGHDITLFRVLFYVKFNFVNWEDNLKGSTLFYFCVDNCKWTNRSRIFHINKPPWHFILDHILLHCESTKSEIFALSLFYSHAACLKDQSWMYFADFWMEFLQLGFILVISWWSK